MDLKKALIEKRSKSGVTELAKWIGTNEDRFAQVWQLMMSQEKPYASYAAWVIDHSLLAHSTLLMPHLDEAIASLDKPHHDAICRNVLKHLGKVSIPEDHQGALYDYCLNAIGNPQKSVAIRVYSIEIAFQIGKAWPELLEELQQVLEAHMADGSAGFRSRGNRILTKIQKILS